MKLRTKEIFASIALPAWLLISVIIFALANRVSYLHAFILSDWGHFITGVLRISFLGFVFDLFSALIGILFFSTACLGAGLVILKILKISSASKLALGTTAFVIGEIIFSIFFLSIISISSLNPSTTITTLGLSIVVSYTSLRDYFRRDYRHTHAEKLDPSQKIFLWLAIGVMLLSLLFTSARLGYDAVSDYFSQAKLMADSREASSFFPENYMIVSSLHPDILFTALMQVFGDQSARMLSWINGLAIILIGYAIAEENGISLNARLYFLALMLSSTAFTDLLGDGKVELICTTPIVAAVYWLPASLKTPAKSIFLLIGSLAGFAIVSRLYNIFLVPLFIAAFYTHLLIRKYITERPVNLNLIWTTGLKFVRPILWMFPTLLMMGAFHLWLNWLWLDSPFAPLDFAKKLESSNWEWQFDPGMLNTLRALYPFTVTFFNSPQSLGNISPLFIGFLPFVLIKDVRIKMRFSEDLNNLLIPSILTLLLWVMFFYTIVEVRYAMFIWTLLFLPSGHLIEHSLQLSSRFISSTSRLLLIMLLLFTSLRIVLIALSTYSPIDTKGQAHCFDIDFCTFFEPINQMAAPGDRVFALNAYRYYLRKDLFACSSRANEYSNLQKLAEKNSPDFWVELYRQGYRFVAFEKNFSVFHSRFGTIPDPKGAPSWLKITVISSLRENLSYHIEAESPPFQPKIYCAKSTDQDVWHLVPPP